MQIRVCFHSYFKDLTGCEDCVEDVPSGTTLEALLAQTRQRFPKLEQMKRSTLAAVGVDYEAPDYLLKEGDEVSLFPPVQGGSGVKELA